ncbi:MAG: putative baseplate assembly protein [Nitrospira sp.]|nr:putative baseplate assembly protein [Nitrospira sp.]MBS0175255.1 putative baseplate assembly protein [Nitrospira sp.]MBX3339649.1 putative baseplate assembly protein [Nitrospira sp.]MCW5780292.1 putative baseplate assembly protein [Nitrospira sp.]
MSQDPRNECGCCAGIEASTPGLLVNRPGLSAIAYRVGTYQTFRQSLHARLSDGRWPVLRGLRTRDDDDFTIALLDAWAVTGDILTFYQERIANEAYLRTATERLSILEQSRLLGYQLGPGLAASTHLAFTLEDNPGLPAQAALPITLAVGTKVQTVPGPDEQPQTFETVEAIEARPAWNALLAQQTATQPLSWNMPELWLSGSNVGLTVGEVVLVVVESGSGFEASIRRVTGVLSDPDRRSTKLLLATISTSAQTIAATKPGVYVLRSQASPFGHNAPLQPQFNSSGVFQGTFSEWALDADETVTRLTLSSRNDKILKDSFVVIEQDDPANGTRIWTFAVATDVVHRSVARYGIAGNGTRLSLSTGWTKGADSKLDLLRTMTVSAQSEELIPAALPLLYPVYGEVLAFDQLVDGLIRGRPLAVTGVRQAISLKHPAPSPFKGHKVPWGGPQPPPALILDDGGSVLLLPGDVLRMTGYPSIVDGSSVVPLTPEAFGASLTQVPSPLLRLTLMDRDGRAGFLDISARDIELVASDSATETMSEIVLIDEAIGTSITQDRDRTTVQLATALVNVYERATVRINANVAAATHGESVKEPLGSGDASTLYQQFILRQPPLTYVSADTPTGSASTLKVYVNEVLWEEVPFFYGHGPTERIYITRRDDEGRTTIRFGDGISGARLPTGQNNVRAEYRKGIGLGGLARTGQLSLLMSRPLGLKGVLNPEAAQGAEDPESRDDARTNAPLTVLTLDRAVSLQDYEDFARTFSGVAKAQAVWVWDGRKRSIFLTVAGPAGELLEEGGSVITKLKASLRTYGDPFVVFTVKPYRQAWFEVEGTVTIDPDHVIEVVMNAISADLQQRYALEARAFGQPVALSEVIAAIQAVPGVVAVDLDRFARTDQSLPSIQPRLIADRPAMGADGVVPAAELLLLDPESLTQLKAIQ